MSDKLSRVTVIVVILTIVCFGAVSYMIARINTENDSNVTMTNAGTVISGLVTDFMGPKINAVRQIGDRENVAAFINSCGSAVSDSELKQNALYADVEAMLDKVCADDKDIVSAWLAVEGSGVLIGDNGKYIAPDTFALKDRYWYKRLSLSNAEKSSVMCTASVSSMFDSSINVVNVINPVFFDGGIIGYVGVEINIDSMSTLLSSYTLNSGCYPIVTCNFGTYIYTPSTDSFCSKFNVNRPPLSNVLVQAEYYGNGIDSISLGLNKTIYFCVNNTDVPGWSIIVLFDLNELNGGIYKYFFQTLIILVCMCILMLIILRNVFKSRLSLFAEIDNAMEKLKDGDYKTTVDAAAAEDTELKRCAASINAIAADMKEKDEKIRLYSENDVLTGLPNRSTLYRNIDALMSERENGERARFALMFVDIDNFKWLNENLGHNFGDEVLRMFAEILSSKMSKYGSVYRFSGDEFIILVEFGGDYNIIHDVINILQNSFDKPIKVMMDSIYIRFSVGVSIYPDDDEKADMLLRDADLALHRSKDNGKDRISFYSNAAKRHSFSKAAIAQRISNALHDNEMYLNYQPIICADTCDIHGFEVLLRWNSTEYGNIPPAEFISVAEETGAIIQIGTWIFESACRFLKQLCDNYRSDIIMSINVSPVQLRRADYLEHVKRVIEITQVNPANIQIEITESTLIDFLDSDNSIMREINDMGISIALDDFGTGYSSLNYLKNFPIKCLKIDKSFVDEINNNKRDYAITDSIIDLVHNLGIKTVAEGIETVGQYDFLKKMKCDYIQGFLMSKPLDEASALEFVEMYDAMHKPDGNVLAEHEKQLARERDKKMYEKSAYPFMDDGTNLVDTVISK